MHFVQRKLTSLAELAGEGWDVVVNCSGLGARQLLPDRNSYPIRGQIMRVRAPWVNQCVFAHFPDETSYIIPNRWEGVKGGCGCRQQQQDVQCWAVGQAGGVFFLEDMYVWTCVTAMGPSSTVALGVSRHVAAGL